MARAGGFSEKGVRERQDGGERSEPFFFLSFSLFWVYKFFLENINLLDVFPLTFPLGGFLWPFNGGTNPAACEMEKCVLMWSLLVLCWAAALPKPTWTSTDTICPGGPAAPMGCAVPVCQGWVCRSLGFVNYYLDIKNSLPPWLA